MSCAEFKSKVKGVLLDGGTSGKAYLRKCPSWLKENLHMPRTVLSMLMESPSWMLLSKCFKPNDGVFLSVIGLLVE